MFVRSVSVDDGESTAEIIEQSGARRLADCEGEEPEPWLRKLLGSSKVHWAGKNEEKRGSKVVHRVWNLPPLPCKLVEMIQERSFVEFAWFPVFDEGPKD